MSNLDTTPNPTEDLKHAHKLLEGMTPEELRRATYALEDIIEGAIYVTHDSAIEDEEIDAAEQTAVEQGRRDVQAGRLSSLENTLEALGLPVDALQHPDDTSSKDHRAA
jgi:hypothetical protein